MFLLGNVRTKHNFHSNDNHRYFYVNANNKLEGVTADTTFLLISLTQFHSDSQEKAPGT